MNETTFHIGEYLNVELVPQQALEGKQIRGVFTPTNNLFVFIVTEDNCMSIYRVENRIYTSPFSCTCEGSCVEEDEANYGVYEITEGEDLVDTILYCQDDFFFEKYNVFKDKEALEKEVARREAIQQQKFINQEREKRFALYKELEKEFANYEQQAKKKVTKND